jgi:phosphoserine phosphatase
MVDSTGSDDADAPDSPRRDPRGYTPGDIVGVALDMDGTAYRDGSVFVETMAYLPFVDGFDVDDAGAAHLRRALLAVAEYGGGPDARRRWERVLRGIDRLGRCGAPFLARGALDGLSRLRSRSTGGAPTLENDPGRATEYPTMREHVLAAYGRFLRGRRPAAVDRAVARVVDRRVRRDADLDAALGRVRRAGGEVYLVTDAPEDVAEAFCRARGLDGVVATRYPVTDGRYTGEFVPVDKATAVARLRRDRGWDYVVAAGDSAVDLGMAPAAEVTLAVAGQGDVTEALADDVVRYRHEALSALGPDRRTAFVDEATTVGEALAAVFDLAGVDPVSKSESG